MLLSRSARPFKTALSPESIRIHGGVVGRSAVGREATPPERRGYQNDRGFRVIFSTWSNLPSLINPLPMSMYTSFAIRQEYATLLVIGRVRSMA